MHPTPRNDGATGSRPPLDTAPLNFLYEIVLTLHEQMNEESLVFIEKVFDRASEIVYDCPQAQSRALTNDASGYTQP